MIVIFLISALFPEKYSINYNSRLLKNSFVIQVWDSCSDAMITLNHDDLTEDLAYLVENDVILEAVNRTLVSTPNDVTLRYGSKVKEYELPNVRSAERSESAWARLHMDDGGVIQTRLLVSDSVV